MKRSSVHNRIQFLSSFQIPPCIEFLGHIEAIMKIKFADEFAGEFDVGDLVFPYGDEQPFAWLRVHYDVGGLQRRIAEEAVGVEVFVFDLVELLVVGGDEFEPAEGGDHAEEEMEFGRFGGLGLEKDCGFGGGEGGREEMGGGLEGGLG